MANVVPFRPRSILRGSSAPRPLSGRPYRGRLSRVRGSGAVPTQQRGLLKDLNQAAAWAGLTTFLWYAVGMVPVQLAVIGQFGLDHAQISSWMFIIWATGAVSSIFLSLIYRQPLATTSSLSALIFLGTLQGRFGFEDIAGANMMAGLLVVLLARYSLHAGSCRHKSCGYRRPNSPFRARRASGSETWRRLPIPPARSRFRQNRCRCRWR